MTQHEQLLENIIKQLILQPEEVSNIVVTRIREAWLRRLKSIYPVVCVRLGRKCDEILGEYIRQHPPRTWNMQLFGSDLPLYLKTWVQSRRNDKFLPELADFEWSIFGVQNAPHESSDTDKLILNPFVKYLKFRYGIYSWWKTKKNTPKFNSELVVVSRDENFQLIIFEPTMIEASVVDHLSEMGLTSDQLVSSIGTTLPGSSEEQVLMAVESLTQKGVLRPRSPKNSL